MTTVQGLINLHNAAQKYEYEHIRVRYIDGYSEGFSNVSNLHVDGDEISFTSTHDMREIYPDQPPQVNEKWIVGKIISKSKRIM